MFVPTEPTVRLRWLDGRDPGLPPWFADDEWIPQGRKELYAYGRTGVYAFLENLDLNDGAALVPAYVPESAVWPFRKAGLDIEYYPISESLSYPFDEVSDRIREVRPEVVLFTHYLGFADPNFRRLVDVAREEGATVIEDCSRAAFSRDADGRLLGSTGDAALYSLHKTLPAPNGGLLVTRGTAPVPPVEQVSETSDLLTLAATTLIDSVDARPFVRSLNGNGSYHSFEYHYDRISDPPAGAWPPKLPGWISNVGFSHTSPREVQRTRRDLYERLRTRLESIEELTVLTPEAHEGACPYGVAVRLPGGHKRRETLYQALRKRGLPVTRYIWPLEEGKRVLEAYSATSVLRTSTLVFPVHHQMPDGTVDCLVSAIESELSAVGRSDVGSSAVDYL
ncbi:DegT/DnrJ/EryC1/StrS family aminotransferase [Halopelagius fulvigenes]|uniref:DegT/DnrJ/EryC1/StrS family aminotransferase n=1 Tax=Halopelagius fulvigenes TaxID=1198324 RepID=A0ABD5TVV2_9EURY